MMSFRAEILLELKTW